MKDTLTLYETCDGIAFVTLNDPARRNPLSSAMMRELLDRLRSAERDAGVRVVALRAKGPAFSAGHDLRELAGGDLEEQTAVFDLCTRLMESVRLLPKPVIAQIGGIATAAGCQLVATCDLAVASTDAAFATPGVDIGLFCTTPGVALGRAVPRKRAMEMLLTGTPISADAALESGLVNRVVPPADLESETLALARKVASAPASVVAIGKSAFHRQMVLDRPSAYDLAQRVMVENLQTADAKEGISAFLEKRQPNWQS